MEDFQGCQRTQAPVIMEAAKFMSAATLACVLVLCITSMSVTWHNVSEVARLQSRVEGLEAEIKSNSISQLLGQLGVQTSVYQEDGIEEEIPGHHREVRQLRGRLELRDPQATGERRANKATQGSKIRRELGGRWENKDCKD